MSNRYYDSYIYAVDSSGQKHFVAYSYHGHLGGAYKSEVYIGNKCYSVFNGIDDEDDEIRGEYLSALGLEDCCSHFSEKPTNDIQKVIEVAGLKNSRITQLIWLHFVSTYSTILSADGYIFSACGEMKIEPKMLESVIAQYNSSNLEVVVTQILNQLT